MGAVLRRPVLTVVVVAAVVRLVVAAVTFVGDVDVPDEEIYLDVARRVADGRGAESFRAGYGQDLYDSRWLFLAPLARLADVFGPSRLPGQLLVAAAGTAAVALVALTARRIVPAAGTSAALVAGLVMALLPSQVLWSSVVLADALIWAAVAAVAWGVMGWCTGQGCRPAAAGVAVAGGLLALGWLRPQTLVIAAWAVAVAAIVIAWRRWAVMAVGVGLAAVVPLLAGLGVGGVGLVADEAPEVGEIRTLMSMGAESGLVRPSSDVSLPPELEARAAQVVEAQKAPGMTSRKVGEVTAEGRRYEVFVDDDARLYLAEVGAGASVRHLPTGVAVALLRPYPWERADSLQSRLGSVENVGWYLLYGLAVLGLVRARPSTRRRLVFPVVFAALYVGAAALSQGNVGTAFRHRGQILWVLALCAAVALASRHGVEPGAGGGGSGGVEPDSGGVD